LRIVSSSIWVGVREQLCYFAHHGPERVRKAVSQAFVPKLIVEDRQRIRPTFKVRGRRLVVQHEGTDAANPTSKTVFAP
jgi:hypothetical protein